MKLSCLYRNRTNLSIVPFGVLSCATNRKVLSLETMYVAISFTFFCVTNVGKTIFTPWFGTDEATSVATSLLYACGRLQSSAIHVLPRVGPSHDDRLIRSIIISSFVLASFALPLAYGFDEVSRVQ